MHYTRKKITVKCLDLLPEHKHFISVLDLDLKKKNKKPSWCLLCGSEVKTVFIYLFFQSNISCYMRHILMFLRHVQRCYLSCFHSPNNRFYILHSHTRLQPQRRFCKYELLVIYWIGKKIILIKILMFYLKGFNKKRDHWPFLKPLPLSQSSLSNVNLVIPALSPSLSFILNPSEQH